MKKAATWIAVLAGVIAAMISIGQAQGGEAWLAGWLLCAAFYFVLLLLWKNNQTGANAKNIVFWFLAAECCSDLIWAVVSYGSPATIQYGIAAVYGLLLWPCLLLAAGAIASAQNRKKNHLV